MLSLKSHHELEAMRMAGYLSAKTLELAGKSLRPGMTTKELDTILHDYIVSKGAKPSFLGYGGFPGCACISINNEVIHGIPGKRVIEEGDIVSVDVGAYIDGFHGDNAKTFIVGEADQSVKDFVKTVEQSLYEGIKMARKGNRIGDISHAVQTYAEERGYGVVRKFVGHGVGRKLHEDPEVPNFGPAGRGVRLLPGMTIAIEPMINMGSANIKVLPDGWTVETVDKSLSAHFEHTVAITDGDPIILTSPTEEGLHGA
jgi:methionyl aminopeptidase